jgi:hypothetical protein
MYENPCDCNLLAQCIRMYMFRSCCHCKAISRIYCVVHQETHIWERTKERKKDSTLLLIHSCVAKKNCAFFWQISLSLLLTRFNVDLANMSFLVTILCHILVTMMICIKSSFIYQFRLWFIYSLINVEKTWLHVPHSPSHDHIYIIFNFLLNYVRLTLY